MSKLVGIDIGGTFTDLVTVDSETGRVVNVKVNSTPHNQTLGIFNALKKANVDLKDVSYFVHGCTVATNIIVERKGAKAGLITTKGFRDVLEIMRGNREFHYNLQWEKPAPFIPRYLRKEVTERLDYKGRVLIPLNEEEVREIARFYKKEEVESIAVCTLHSFMNPVHEQRIEEIIREEYPGVFVSISSKILPEIREYERTCTVVMDAYVKPEVHRYVKCLAGELKKEGLQKPLMLIKSNGGVMTPKMVLDMPICTIGSGPAGGVIGAMRLGSDIITCDLGGTSFDVSMISKGRAKHTTQKDVVWGMPLRVPQIDILSVGSGGGSIAWIDTGGLLRVGPRSAGAVPGPACYGQGGVEPTLTDACIVLDIFSQNSFLEGDMKIDKNLSAKAIEEKLVPKLNKSLMEIAKGIYEIAIADMIEAIRMISVQKGFDPREFMLVPFGGGGPVFASKIAQGMKMKKVLFPLAPGVFSAQGCLFADPQFDLSQSYPVKMENIDIDKLNNILNELENKCKQVLREEDFVKNLDVIRTADMRYSGQNFEIETEVPEGEMTQENIGILINNFHDEHVKWYGYKMEDEPVNLISLRVCVKSKQSIVPSLEITKGKVKLEGSPRQKRMVYMGKEYDFAECQIYLRDELSIGSIINGPAIIEQKDTTIIILPCQVAEVKEEGNLLAVFK